VPLFFRQMTQPPTLANETLMSLVRPNGVQQLSLPELLVLANQIHNVAPRYWALSTNCFWFADAMFAALQHYGFVIHPATQEAVTPEQAWELFFPQICCHRSTDESGVQSFPRCSGTFCKSPGQGLHTTPDIIPIPSSTLTT